MTGAVSGVQKPKKALYSLLLVSTLFFMVYLCWDFFQKHTVWIYHCCLREGVSYCHRKSGGDSPEACVKQAYFTNERVRGGALSKTG